MIDKKQLAQHLYMTQGKTQKEIAMEIGVSERTVYTWIHQYAWDKLKRAAYQAPATISENLCCELIELQNAIARRQPGMRYPTPQEAEVIRKLIGSIERMKKYPSLSQNMQMLETFKNYIRPIDKEFARELSIYTERFLAGKSVNGFAPYQMEYGIEQVAPIMPLYDEPTEPTPCACPDPAKCPISATCANPCTDFDECKHPGSCSAPHCIRTQRFMNDIASDNSFQKNCIKPIPAITEEESRIQYEIYMEENGFTINNGTQQPEETGSIPATLDDTIIDGSAPDKYLVSHKTETPSAQLSRCQTGVSAAPDKTLNSSTELFIISAPEVSPQEGPETLTDEENDDLPFPWRNRKEPEENPQFD